MAEQDSASLEALLAEIEAEIAERQTAADFIRKRLGLSPDEGRSNPAVNGVTTPASRGGTSPGPLRGDSFFGMKIPQAIKRYLEIMKSPQAPKAIASGLLTGGLLSNSSNFYTTMWTGLKRLEGAGDVVNTKNGYGLATWYPSRPKPPETKKPKPKKRAKGGIKTATLKTPPPPKDAGAQPKAPKSAYHAFVAEQMKHGKSMAEAAEAWKTEKLLK